MSIMQELATTEEYAVFVKRNFLLVYMFTLQSRKLEIVSHLCQMELTKMEYQRATEKFYSLNCGSSCNGEIVNTCIVPVKIRYLNNWKEVSMII